MWINEEGTSIRVGRNRLGSSIEAALVVVVGTVKETTT
jgi:hypothetical protein